MKNEEKVQINVPADYSGQPIEVLIREGEAPALNERVGFGKRVIMTSIAEFVSKRAFSSEPKENVAIVTYSLNPDRPSLEIDLNPHDELEPKLTSVLKINPDLVAFGINEDKFFNQKQLVKHIMKYAHCFANLDDAKTMLNSLRNFEAKFEQTVKKADDRQGNTEDYVASAIKMTSGAIPTEWKLNMPLYIGAAKDVVNLEVQIEKVPGTNLPGFAFYSLDVAMLIRERAEETVLAEVEKLRPLFVCLEVE